MIYLLSYYSELESDLMAVAMEAEGELDAIESNMGNADDANKSASDADEFAMLEIAPHKRIINSFVDFVKNRRSGRRFRKTIVWLALCDVLYFSAAAVIRDLSVSDVLNTQWCELAALTAAAGLGLVHFLMGFWLLRVRYVSNRERGSIQTALREIVKIARLRNWRPPSF